jgi:uncharacterized membrane protein YfcA
MADDAALALAAAGLAVGASTQAATGFGFALVAAPAIGAALDPARAVGLLALLGFGLNAATLARRADRDTVRRADAARLLAWALPGMAAGAALLRWVPPDALRIASGVLAIAAAAVTVAGWRPAVVRRAGPAGVSAGLLTTTTGFNGPPLVLHLLAHHVTADELRSTLAACFAATGAIGLVALAAAGTLRVPGSAWALAVGAGACALGWAVGRGARSRLSERGLRLAATATVALAGGAAIVVGAT